MILNCGKNNFWFLRELSHSFHRSISYINIPPWRLWQSYNSTQFANNILMIFWICSRWLNCICICLDYVWLSYHYHNTYLSLLCHLRAVQLHIILWHCIVDNNNLEVLWIDNIYYDIVIGIKRRWSNKVYRIAIGSSIRRSINYINANLYLFVLPI